MKFRQGLRALFFCALKFVSGRSIVSVNVTASKHMTYYSDNLIFSLARASCGLSLPARLLPLRG